MEPRSWSSITAVKSPLKKQRIVGPVTKQNELLTHAIECLRVEPKSTEIPAIAKVWGEKLLLLNARQRIHAEKAINDILYKALLTPSEHVNGPDVEAISDNVMGNSKDDDADVGGHVDIISPIIVASSRLSHTSITPLVETSFEECNIRGEASESIIKPLVGTSDENCKPPRSEATKTRTSRSSFLSIASLIGPSPPRTSRSSSILFTPPVGTSFEECQKHAEVSKASITQLVGAPYEERQKSSETTEQTKTPLVETFDEECQKSAEASDETITPLVGTPYEEWQKRSETTEAFQTPSLSSTAIIPLVGKSVEDWHKPRSDAMSRTSFISFTPVGAPHEKRQTSSEVSKSTITPLVGTSDENCQNPRNDATSRSTKISVTPLAGTSYEEWKKSCQATEAPITPLVLPSFKDWQKPCPDGSERSRTSSISIAPLVGASFEDWQNWRSDSADLRTLQSSSMSMTPLVEPSLEDWQNAHSETTGISFVETPHGSNYLHETSLVNCPISPAYNAPSPADEYADLKWSRSLEDILTEFGLTAPQI